MFSEVGGPPAANGSTWWNSMKALVPHRFPAALAKAHRPPSRNQTVRRTAAGM